MRKSDLLDPSLVVHNRQKFASICNGSFAVTGPYPDTSYKFQKMAWIRRMLQIFPLVVWLDADAFVVKPLCPNRWGKHKSGVSLVIDTNLPDRFNAGVMIFRRGDAFDDYDRIWTKIASFDASKSDNHVVNRVLLNTNNPPSYEVLPSSFNSYPSLKPCGRFSPHTRHDKFFSNATVHHYPGLYSGINVHTMNIEQCMWLQTRQSYYNDAHALDNTQRSVSSESFVVLTSFFPYNRR
jgi:hypothetical protein